MTRTPKLERVHYSLLFCIALMMVNTLVAAFYYGDYEKARTFGLIMCTLTAFFGGFLLGQAYEQSEVARLRDLLQNNQADASHQCRKCLFRYTPYEGQSEDCPKCGHDGKNPLMNNGLYDEGNP